MSRMPRGITGLPRAPGHGPLHVPRGTPLMQMQEGGAVDIPEWMKPDPMADTPTTTWPPPTDPTTPWPSPTPISSTDTFAAPTPTYTQHGGGLFGTPPVPTAGTAFTGFEGTPDFTRQTFLDPAATEQAHTPITLPPAGQPTPNLFGAVYSPVPIVPDGNGGNGGNGVTPTPSPHVPFEPEVPPDEIEVRTEGDYAGWPTKPPEKDPATNMFDPDYLKVWNEEQDPVVKDAFSGDPNFIAATEQGLYPLTSEGYNAYKMDTLGTIPGGPPTGGAEREPSSTGTYTSVPQPGQTGDARWYIPSREERMEAAWDQKQLEKGAFTPPGPDVAVTQVITYWYNPVTGERRMFNTGGYSPPPGSSWIRDPDAGAVEDNTYSPPAAAASPPPDVAPQYTPTAAPPENFGTLDEYLGSIEPGYTPYVPQVIPEEEPYVPYEPPLDLPTAPVFGGTPAAPTENFVGPTTDFRYSNIPEGVPTTMEDLNAYQNQWDNYLGRMYAGGGPVQYFQTGAGVEAERSRRETEAAAAERVRMEELLSNPDFFSQFHRSQGEALPVEPEVDDRYMGGLQDALKGPGLSGVYWDKENREPGWIDPESGAFPDFTNEELAKEAGLNLKQFTDIIYDPTSVTDNIILAAAVTVPPAAVALWLLKRGYQGTKLLNTVANIHNIQRKLPKWLGGGEYGQLGLTSTGGVNIPSRIGASAQTYIQGQIGEGITQLPREILGPTIPEERQFGGGISSLSIGT